MNDMGKWAIFEENRCKEWNEWCGVAVIDVPIKRENRVRALRCFTKQKFSQEFMLELTQQIQIDQNLRTLFVNETIELMLTIEILFNKVMILSHFTLADCCFAELWVMIHFSWLAFASYYHHEHPTNLPEIYRCEFPLGKWTNWHVCHVSMGADVFGHHRFDIHRWAGEDHKSNVAIQKR